MLDAHLRSLDSRKLTLTELLAQISCSSWMRRLWTLQEGRLAARVWFQLANKAVDVPCIWNSLDHRSIPSRAEYWISHDLYVHLFIHIWYRGQAFGALSKVAGIFGTNYHALASRSVSVPTDEALCLFNVMGLDIKQVTAVEPAQRMEVFWRTLQRVPKSLIFSKASNKISVEGLHWAPSSFMGNQIWSEWAGPQELRTPEEDDAHAVPTSLGLRVELPGFILHEELHYMAHTLPVFQDEDCAWYTMRLDQPWRQGSAISDATQQLAIVLAHELKGVDAQRPSRPPSSFKDQFPTKYPSQDISNGILVTLVKTEDDTLYVSARNHVDVERVGDSHRRFLTSASLCVEEVNVPHSILHSETHDQLKARYETAARRRLNNEDLIDLDEVPTRHFGGKDDYEALLDSFLRTTVVTARFGDWMKAKKVPAHQQWCVD